MVEAELEAEMAAAGEMLGAEAASRAVAEGHALTQDEAVAYVRGKASWTELAAALELRAADG